MTLLERFTKWMTGHREDLVEARAEVVRLTGENDRLGMRWHDVTTENDALRKELQKWQDMARAAMGIDEEDGDADQGS